MKLSDELKRTLRLLAVLFVSTASTILAGAEGQPAISEKTYTEHLQEKLLKVYCPPRGPFNFAESEIKLVIEANGKAKIESIVQPPMVHNKRSALADGCLKAAVENVNPLEPPPKEMKLPIRFSVRFIRQAKGDFVFKCVAKKL